MTIKVRRLTAWEQTKNTLVSNLGETLEFQNEQPFSQDPESNFQRANSEMARIESALREHARNGLKSVDAAIATGQLVREINDLSKQARREAERLQRITKTLTDISKAIDTATAVASRIAGLPFL